MSGYKVGDRVSIKSIEMLSKYKLKLTDGSLSVFRDFTPEMEKELAKAYPDRILTIDEINCEPSTCYYRVKEFSWLVAYWVIEGVVDSKGDVINPDGEKVYFHEVKGIKKKKRTLFDVIDLE